MIAVTPNVARKPKPSIMYPEMTWLDGISNRDEGWRMGALPKKDTRCNHYTPYGNLLASFMDKEDVWYGRGHESLQRSGSQSLNYPHDDEGDEILERGENRKRQFNRSVTYHGKEAPDIGYQQYKCWNDKNWPLAPNCGRGCSKECCASGYKQEETHKQWWNLIQRHVIHLRSYIQPRGNHRSESVLYISNSAQVLVGISGRTLLSLQKSRPRLWLSHSS